MTRSTLFASLTLGAFALGLTACGGEPDDTAKTVQDGSDVAQQTAPAAADQTSAPVDLGDSLAVKEMVQGDPNAPVTLIEYASVTCPHCAAFHETIYPEVKEKFVDTGKVKLIYREFPTNPPELAYIGFALARCSVDHSGSSESYFATIEALYKTQHDWISQNFKSEILKIAAQAGMDEGAVDACLQRQEIVDAINENIKSGDQEYNVIGTPSFYIGKQKIEARNKDDFIADLEKAISAAE